LPELRDPTSENTFNEVGYQILQHFNDGSDIIIHLNKGSSREFTLELVKEEKVEGAIFWLWGG
jgi:hypothetical protein